MNNPPSTPQPTPKNTQTQAIATLAQGTVESSGTSTTKLTSIYKSRLDFFTDEAYGEYIKSVILQDMRVRAIVDYKIVKKGMVGTFFSLDYIKTVCWIIWDEKLNVDLNSYLAPDGLPSDKYSYAYSVPCHQIEIIP